MYNTQGIQKGVGGWGGFLKQLGPEGVCLFSEGSPASVIAHVLHLRFSLPTPASHCTPRHAMRLLSFPRPAGVCPLPWRATQLELVSWHGARSVTEYHFSTRRILNNEYVSLLKLLCWMVDAVLAVGCICAVVSYQSKKRSEFILRPQTQLNSTTRPLTPREWADQAMLDSYISLTVTGMLLASEIHTTSVVNGR